jgi:hypothetical protein
MNMGLKNFSALLFVMRIRSSDSHFALINSDMISDGYNFGTLNAFNMTIKDAANDIWPISIQEEKITESNKS